MKGFKKCYITRAMDETDDDMLWNGSVVDGNIIGPIFKGQEDGSDRLYHKVSKKLELHTV